MLKLNLLQETHTRFWLLLLDPLVKLKPSSAANQPYPLTRTCFCFFNCCTTLNGIFNVLATISLGVSANHCVKLISATRSDL